ncbi:MAG: hypothetical protein JWQ42_3556 [Edaphobacter sp.]|nr:hypothetical protein [Edaphobacter sp.]
MRRNLQISLGLRYDWQTYIETSHNFGPRVSLAYSPEKDRKTVYRAGYGTFYDRSGARPISEVKRFNGETVRSITILNPTYGRLIPPGQTIATLPTDLTTFAPNITMPLLNFFSIGIDRQIAKGASLSISYRGNIGIDLFRSLDVNAPLDPGSSSLRPNPSLGFVRQVQSRGHQVSNAVDFTFRGNMGR